MRSLQNNIYLSHVDNDINKYTVNTSVIKIPKIEEYVGINDLFLQPIFYYNHKYGLKYSQFKSSSRKILAEEIEPYVLNDLPKGEVVTYAKYKNLPFYMSQFHIEKKTQINDPHYENMRLHVKIKFAHFIKD